MTKEKLKLALVLAVEIILLTLSVVFMLELLISGNFQKFINQIYYKIVNFYIGKDALRNFLILLIISLLFTFVHKKP